MKQQERTGQKIKISAGEQVLHGVNIILILLATFVCVYPFYYMLIYSVSDASKVLGGIYFLPKGFTLQTYKWIFATSDFGHAFWISGTRTVIQTVLCLLGSSLFAYLVTQRDMIGRKFVYRFVVITMYLSAGLIPWYITMKSYHLNNTYWLYIIPGIVNAYYVILLKTFIEQIPDSLQESAKYRWRRIFQNILVDYHAVKQTDSGDGCGVCFRRRMEFVAGQLPVGKRC